MRVFMVLLGGTTTGKTFHFGPDGALVRGLRDALGAGAVRGLRPLLTVEVSPVPGGRGSTVSIDFYGAEIDLYPRREYMGWIDMPGQDYLVACPIYRRIAEEGRMPPGDPDRLLGMLEAPGRPAEILEAVRRIVTGTFEAGLLSGEALAMGFYGMYTDIAPGSEKIVARLGQVLEHLESELRERTALDSPGHAWALLNAAIFHAVHYLASTVRRDLERRRIGSRRFLEALRVESILASTLARAYLERATHASARDLYPQSLEHDGVAPKACIGPGCPRDSWPHRLVEADTRVYSTATAMLMEHQALIAGPLAGLLQLEMARRTGLHALTHPIDQSYPAARYLERNISMRSGPQALQRVKQALREAVENGCKGEHAQKALEAARNAALESVTPVRVIQSLALEECPAQPREDPARIIAELAGAKAPRCPEERAREILEILAKHYTYTGPLGDLLVSHTRTISHIWRAARRPEALLLVLTFTDLASQRAHAPPDRLARAARTAILEGKPLPGGLQPFPLEQPPGGLRGRLAVVPGGAYKCCRTGPCNPALTVGYLASLMAVASG